MALDAIEKELRKAVLVGGVRLDRFQVGASKDRDVHDPVWPGKLFE
jgi:hypothetical protein